MALYLYDSKLLLDTGKLATAIACCCRLTVDGCYECIDNLAWSEYTVVVSGFTGGAAVLNGSYVVEYQAGCSWKYTFPSPVSCGTGGYDVRALNAWCNQPGTNGWVWSFSLYRAIGIWKGAWWGWEKDSTPPPPWDCLDLDASSANTWENDGGLCDSWSQQLNFAYHMTP